MNQILNYDMIKLLNEPNNDPIRLLPLKNQKPNTSSTPSKNTKPHPKLQTPTKEATPIFPDQEFEEDYKENKQNLPLEAPEEEIKAEDSFQPMGKAALTNKKNPWTVITSNKVLPKTKPLPKDPIPAPKPTKRLDLQALKKKGKNVKEKPGVKTLDIEKDRESSPDYYEKSSKFNTVTDPRTFAPENLMLNKWNNGEEVSESHIEIEENIKEIESMRGSKRPIKEKLPVSSVFKSTEKKDFLGDSMRSPLKRDFIEENRGEKQGDVNIKGNFYEQELDKMIKEDIRPYSPPFNGGSNKSGDGEIKKSKSPLEGIKKGEENMLEVVFDPVLNCYYDPKTNSYYDLIN